MKDTFIFDFDGTLADTTKVVTDAFKHIYKVYNKEFDEEYIQSIYGEPIKSIFTRDFPDQNLEDVIKIYRDYQIEQGGKSIILYPNVKETLEELKSRGAKLGIATSRQKDTTLEYLDFLGIKSYFASIITVDDVKKPKPDAEPILKCIENLNSSVDKTVYVGDSHFDVESALNAGVSLALVNYHKNSKELAKKYNVRYLLDDMRQLLDIFFS